MKKVFSKVEKIFVSRLNLILPAMVSKADIKAKREQAEEALQMIEDKDLTNPILYSLKASFENLLNAENDNLALNHNRITRALISRCYNSGFMQQLLFETEERNQTPNGEK